jgi:hypothetical protein
MLIDAVLYLLRLLVRALGGLWHSGRARTLSGVGCIAVLLIAANILAAGGLSRRFDLTADHRYTLSAATSRLLARIDEPITLDFYYSQRLDQALPAEDAYETRVRVLLDRYVAAAHGKLRLNVLNPEPLSKAEHGALAAGLRPVVAGRENAAGFFGLAGSNSTDDKQIIALFDPAHAQSLEYEISRLIDRLALPNAAADADLAALQRGSGAMRPPGSVERPRRTGNATRLEAAIEFVDITLMPVFSFAVAIAICHRRRGQAAA